MARTTKQQDQARFIREFARRLKAAAPGERIYMVVGDLFKNADEIDLNEKRKVDQKRRTKRDQ